MSWGKLTHVQCRALGPFVRGMVVHDLGAGDLQLSHHLLALGARCVFALDRNAPESHTPAGIIPVKAPFLHFDGAIDVAFVSWPRSNYRNDGLAKLCERARLVIYLGKCVDGSHCGDETFWQCVAAREVLTVAPDPLNTLIVYGPTRVSRPLIAEERAFYNNETIVRYAEAYPCT